MLTFNQEWRNGDDIAPLEVSSTFARLEIAFDVGTRRISLTKHRSLISDSEEDALYTSCYPLALYIAENWWRLLYEPDRELVDPTFRRHHSLSYASHGFPFPDIVISELDGERVVIRASSKQFEFAGLEFLASVNETPISKILLESRLSSFINAVSSKLQANGIYESVLQRIWNTIDGLDSDSLQFCQWAGRFGLNPFDISDVDEERLLSVSLALNAFEIADLASVLDWSTVQSEQEEIRSAFAAAEAHSKPASHKLANLRNIWASVPKGYMPHEQGFWMARELRDDLGLSEDQLVDPLTAFELLSVPVNTQVLPESIRGRISSVLYCSDRIGAIIQDSPYPTQRRFIGARSLCEALTATTTGRSVNKGHTATQKRNRAFAAEFLAPVTALRSKIKTTFIDGDSVSELADDFGVSTFVIQHQLENAGIARVAM